MNGWAIFKSACGAGFPAVTAIFKDCGDIRVDMTGTVFYWNLAPDVPNGFDSDCYEARAYWPGGVPDRKPVMSVS